MWVLLNNDGTLRVRAAYCPALTRWRNNWCNNLLAEHRKNGDFSMLTPIKNRHTAASRGANFSPVGQFDARTSLSFVKPLACSGLLCFCCRQPMAMTVWQTVVEKVSATRNKRH